MKDFQVVIKTPNWRVSRHHRQTILDNVSNARLGWQRVVMIAKNAAAEAFLASQGQVMARQNYQLQGVPMHHDEKRKASLVFYRHNPLDRITLDWLPSETAPELDKDAIFSIAIKPISAAKAWFFMLQAVSRKEKAAGGNASQIYRMTRARQKRQGREHALRKLVQAYQPLLQHQLISCEPFNYWRLHNEPNTQQQLLQCKTKSFQRPCFPLNLDAPIDDDVWYYIDDSGSVKARQFDRLITAAVSVAEQQQAELVYWDHDQLNADGNRVLPNFKPDWSPELLIAQDYIGPCYAVKGSRLKALPKDKTRHYADTYQLLLYLLACQRNTRICHIPVILQHQRSLFSPDADTEQQRQQAINHWLKSTESSPTINFESAVETPIRKPNFPIQTSANDEPTVSIIVPTRDALDITRLCVESVIERTEFKDYELLIVDNQSTCPDTLAWFKEIRQQPRVRVVKYDAPFNYSAINNYAVKQARGDYICLLNNDTEVLNSSWLSELLQQAQRPSIGCVGAKLYYPDNTIQHAGVVLGLWGLAGHAHKNFTRHAEGYNSRLVSLQNYSAVTAACLMINKTLFEEVGGFNEKDLTVAFNDVDLCLKVLRAGYRNVWTPYAELYHYESKSRGREDSPEKKARESREINYMQQQWKPLIERDPAYNPNLTRVQEDFGVNLDPFQLSRHFPWSR